MAEGQVGLHQEMSGSAEGASLVWWKVTEEGVGGNR